MSDNRRAAPRKDAFRIAALRAEDGAAAIECLVWDISETGAQIEVAATEAVPDRFLLQITPYAVPRACTVVRRVGRALGIRFDP